MARPKLPARGKWRRLEHDVERHGEIVAFVHGFEAAEGGLYGSRERAISAACERFDLKDRTTVQRKMREADGWRPAFKRLRPVVSQALADLDRIREHLTPDELEQMRDVGVDILHRIATDRAELARLRANKKPR